MQNNIDDDKIDKDDTKIGLEIFETTNDKISFEQLQPLVVTRNLLAINVYKPFFDSFKGSMVRVRFQHGHALCKILDIVYGDDYSFRLGNYSFLADKYLTVKNGDNKLEVPICYISNSLIEQEEYNMQTKTDLPMTIISEYIKLRKLMEREMTYDEKQAYKNEKRKFMCDFDQRKNHFKNCIDKMRQHAQKENNIVREKELNDVFNKFCDNEILLTKAEVNEYARNYYLKMPHYKKRHN